MKPVQTITRLLLRTLLAVFLTACPLTAFGADMQWGGHIKALGDVLWPASETGLDRVGNPPLNNGSLDFRLTNQTQLPWKTEFEIHYEAICNTGDLVRNTRKIEAKTPGPTRTATLLDPDQHDRRQLMDLTGTLDTGSSHVYYHRLDRLNLTVLPEWGYLRIGRQAITWGDGFVFNPMDLFNPFAPTDIERDYKNGVDMTLVQFLSDNGADLQALYIPRRDPLNGEVDTDFASTGAKLHFSTGGLEYDLMAAKHYRDFVGGMGASGYAGGSAWRINLTWTMLDDRARHENDYLSLVANLDYSWNWWQRNFYGFIEGYYNGLGRSDYPAALADPVVVERIDRGELFVLGKRYLSGQIQAEVHPLFNCFLNLIVNTDDPSALIQAWGQWDAAQNLRVVLGARLASGADGTEYGGFVLPESGMRVGAANSVYTRITLFF